MVGVKKITPKPVNISKTMNQGVTQEESLALVNITHEMNAYNHSRMYDLNGLVETVERDKITQALKFTDGNRTRAAEMLGLKRTGLLAKMRKYEIK
jgi:DNA-binding protein Fis